MKRAIFALCFVLCLMGFFVFWVLRSRSPIDKSIYDAISLGMPENEAMALVPIPHRARGEAKSRRASARLLAEAGTTNFKNDDVVVKEAEDGAFFYFEIATRKELAKVRFWDTDDYSLVILFSPEGKVMGKTIYRFVYAD